MKLQLSKFFPLNFFFRKLTSVHDNFADGHNRREENSIIH